MQSPYKFIISPIEGKYRTTKKINDKTLYLTASIEDAKYVSRIGVVVNTPIFYEGFITKGDIVVIHHNVFRDFYNQNGKVSVSSSYLNYEGTDTFLVEPSLIYLFKSKDDWFPHLDYCFVRPVFKKDKLSNTSILDELKGEVVYSNDISKDSVVWFTPESEYEFEIDGETLYRMKTSDICIIE